jgi:hypothetical protein
MSRTFADPERLLAYGGELLPTEAWLGEVGPGLDQALQDFMTRCPEFGFCPTVTGDEVVRHADRGRTLAEWIAAVGSAFAAADTLPLDGSPGVRSIDDAELRTYLDAVGAFLLVEEAESHAAGIATAQALEVAVDTGDLDAVEELLRSVGAFEDDEVFLRALVLGAGDLDALLDRADALQPRPNVAVRFLGGAWDSITGTGELVWGLTGRVLHDPSGWAGTWGDLGSSLWWGVQNPKDFALAIVDWDGLRDDPARWLGALAPDVALTFATAGGAAASRGASASRAAMRGLRSADNLGDALTAARQLSRAVRVDLDVGVRTIGGRQVTWSPAGMADASGTVSRVSIGTSSGPLSRLPRNVVSHDPTFTFRGAQYLARTTDEPLTLYRVFTEGGFERGQYWTTVPPAGQSQAILDSALVPSWGNRATAVTEIRVPRGQVVYEGFAAPQPTMLPGASNAVGDLMGGGPQVFVPNVPENWIVDVRPLTLGGR